MFPNILLMQKFNDCCMTTLFCISEVINQLSIPLSRFSLKNHNLRNLNWDQNFRKCCRNFSSRSPCINTSSDIPSRTNFPLSITKIQSAHLATRSKSWVAINKVVPFRYILLKIFIKLRVCLTSKYAVSSSNNQSWGEKNY